MNALYIPILIAAMMGLIALALFLRSRPLAGAILVVATYFFEAVMVTSPLIPLGILIHPEDIVFGLLLIAVAFRYVMGMAKPHGLRWVPICLFTLFVISLARGFATFGVKQAGNESREWFDVLSGVLYFSSFNLSFQVRKKIMSAWFIASIALVGLAVFRWTATLAGLSIVSQWEGLLVGGELRVLNASNAYFLAIAFFASVFLNMSKRGPGWQRKAFFLFGPVILLLQHRTVWAVVIVGLVWLGLQDPRFRKGLIGAIIGMGVAGIALAAFLFGQRGELIKDSLQNSATNSDTLLWRVAGWYQLLFNNPSMNFYNNTLGEPFGTGFQRMIMGARVDAPPHNYYVEAFLRLGMIGLILLVCLLVIGMRRMKRVPAMLRRYAYPDARFWRLVLLLQLVYFFTYGASFDQSILMGIAILGIRLRLRRPAAVPILPPDAPFEPA
jgi:hypothetical protein